MKHLEIGHRKKWSAQQIYIEGVCHNLMTSVVKSQLDQLIYENNITFCLYFIELTQFSNKNIKKIFLNQLFLVKNS